MEADGHLGHVAEAEVVVADVLGLLGGEGLAAAEDVGAGVVAHAGLCEESSRFGSSFPKALSVGNICASSIYVITRTRFIYDDIVSESLLLFI